LKQGVINVRPDFSRNDITFEHSFIWADPILRLANWRESMSTTELVALVISAALLVYLSAALLKPEWFS
jgi:K+-transporting ATPase KdpF subunit